MIKIDKPYYDIREITFTYPLNEWDEVVMRVDNSLLCYYPIIDTIDYEEVLRIDTYIALLYNLVNCYEYDRMYKGVVEVKYWLKLMQSYNYIVDPLYKYIADLINQGYYWYAKDKLFTLSLHIQNYMRSLRKTYLLSEPNLSLIHDYITSLSILYSPSKGKNEL